MNALLAAMLILVPAPKAPTPPTISTIAGCWDCRWGSIEQGCNFLPDGTYHSREFGSGSWTIINDNAVMFLEGQTWWVLMIDAIEVNEIRGRVYSFSDEGVISLHCSPVRIRRGERLPLPRIVE